MIPAVFDAISHRLVLAQWIQEQGLKTVVEVGVKKGTTFLHLLEHCPDMQIVGVDIWENLAQRLPQHEERLRQIVEEKYGERAILMKARSVEAAKRFQDYSLDLVFIDADHTEAAVREDILAWRSKVRPGGMLCGHDVNQKGVWNAVTALCPGWVEHEQAVWAVRPYPIVVTAMPYADDRNYGRACNEVMALLPDDGWAVILDHDAMFTTREWHRQITAAIVAQPRGCFTVKVNRVYCPFQRTEGVDPQSHDVRYHRGVGQRLQAQGLRLRDVTDDREPSGVVMILSKQAWREAGGFPQGLHYVDRMMWLALKHVGRRIYLIEDLYLYHWWRGDNEGFQPGAWAAKHRLPDGRVLALKNPDKLPVFEEPKPC